MSRPLSPTAVLPGSGHPPCHACDASGRVFPGRTGARTVAVQGRACFATQTNGTARPPRRYASAEEDEDGADEEAGGGRGFTRGRSTPPRKRSTPDVRLLPITVQLDDGSRAVVERPLFGTPEWVPSSGPARRVLTSSPVWGRGCSVSAAARVLALAGVRASIDATDYHPRVLANLARNVRHDPRAVGVRVAELDWRAEEGEVVGYDVVLAADVVYRPEHAGWIRGCVERRLGRDGVFWMIVPVRTTGKHEGMGSRRRFLQWARTIGMDLDLEDVRKVEGVGRADEGGYTLFEIRWV